MQNETANAALTKTLLFDGRNIMKMDYKTLRLRAKLMDGLCKHLRFQDCFSHGYHIVDILKYVFMCASMILCWVLTSSLLPQSKSILHCYVPL